MAGLGRQVARIEKDLRNSAADTSQGVCIGIDWDTNLAAVNIAGGVQQMAWDGYAPNEGDTVRVTYAGRIPTCRAVYGSAQGTVTTVAGDFATITGDDGRTYDYPIAVSALAGDRVRLDHAGRLVIAIYAADPAARGYVKAADAPANLVQDLWFYPIDSGNFRLGTYTPGPVEVSDNRAGYYWYGTQIADSIPDGANILEATLALTEEWDNLPGTASHLGTHTQPTRGTAPALSGAINVTGGGLIDISPYATALKTGAAYGVGFAAGSGWRSFGPASNSGGIHIRWK